MNTVTKNATATTNIPVLNRATSTEKISGMPDIPITIYASAYKIMMDYTYSLEYQIRDLTSGIKELYANIDELKQKNAQLTQDNLNLKNQNEQIEKDNAASRKLFSEIHESLKTPPVVEKKEDK